ncbi:MAG: hypothetical protein P1R58_01060 [bacterium]|nr:hypothetical protein [bacterium]
MRITGYLLIALTIVTASEAKSGDVPHQKLKMPCENCHTTESFTTIDFDHVQFTGYDLDGKHRAARCVSCHDLQDFSEVEKNCSNCHADVHESKMGADCQRCHSSLSWSSFDFQEIHINTDFPFMGKHALVDCQSCHTTLPQGDMMTSRSRCVECHQTDYLNTASPNHVADGFSTECQNCHRMHSWRPATIPNHEIYFPIYGGEHAGTWNSCTTCHTDPNDSKVFTCLVCHAHNQSDMDGEHGGMTGYVYNSDDCYLCHPDGRARDFREHDAQYFPIYSGSHASEWSSCTECHTVPADRRQFNCLTCHEHRQQEMDGKHGSMAGYGYDSKLCLECHPQGLKGEFTAHDAEFFPIFSGRHASTWSDCAECHNNPNERQIFDCLTCHPGNEVEPVHNGMAGYSYDSPTCYSCHPTGEAGEFTVHDGTYFPIYSGRHSGKWSDCIECHADPNDRKVFDCLTCHPGSEIDPNHTGMSGYVYDSPTCYSCHPTGEAGEFTDHDGLFFPIFSGTHASQWPDCSSCHPVSGDNSVFDCLSCHPAAQSNLLHGSMSGYTATSSACLSCHPTGLKGTFTGHDNQFFSIYSGKHAGRWSDCMTCHTIPGDRTDFTCFECHEHNQLDMDDRHSGRPGYIYDSDACLSCHPDGND